MLEASARRTCQTQQTESPTFRDKVFLLVEQIPPGRVVTYGQVAQLLGEGTARLVGMALASLPNNSRLPWHRVVNAQGGISPRGDNLSSSEQQRRLEAELIPFNAQGRLDLRRHRWHFGDPSIQARES